MTHPKSIWNYICKYLLGKNLSGYILTDALGRIGEWEGHFDFIPPLAINKNTPITDIFDFMHGILPLENPTLQLPDLKVSPNRIIDVHIFKTEEGYGIVFLNSNTDNEARASLQEFTNATEYENINRFSKLISENSKTISIEKENQNINIVKIPATALVLDITVISQIITSESEKKMNDMLLPSIKIFADAIFEENGRIETLLGTSLTAIFGFSASAESSASKALSAATTIIDSYCTHGEILPLKACDHDIRIGIASGAVFIGSTIVEGRRLFHCHGNCIQMATQLKNSGSESPLLIDIPTYNAAPQYQKDFVPVQTDPESGLSTSDFYEWGLKK